MRGRVLFWILAPCLAVSALAQARSALRALHSSRLVRAVETTSLPAAREGSSGLSLLRINLALARDAVELDPSSIAAAQALGSVYLLLGRPRDAIAAYEGALKLQPAPELYMNLGHACLAAGDLPAARSYFARATTLDSRLVGQVPAAAHGLGDGR